MAADKDTIYVDIDDEITGIIDKLKGSASKVVALVLPKRASVFQSIVNMKLLKRAADSSNKNVVLITSEAGLLPLAGAAGLHVAKTLTSKPEIPMAPGAIVDDDEVEAATPLPSEEPLDQSQPVGQLAGSTASTLPPKDGVETVDFDNEAEPTPDKLASATAAAAGAAEATKPKKDKKLKVPNFERFRLVLALLALLLILLIIGFIFANASLAKATIKISTNATNVPVSQSLNLSPTATSLDTANGVLPAKLDSEQKTYTQQVPTTGQKNNGNKASGSIQMTAQACGAIPNSAPPNVPAGTGVSANSSTYITQQDTSFSSTPTFKNGCLYFQATSATSIIAQNGGVSYNTGNGSNFSVAGRSDVSANGGASGGTDNMVQVVNQNDINSAKSKISSNDTTVKGALKSQLSGEGYFAILPTYSTSSPSVTSSANVGQVANDVTVTETVSYSMFGVHRSDLKTLIDANVSTQIDSSKQSVLDEGIDRANFNVNSNSASGAQIGMTATAVAGPQLDVNSIKQAAAGKKAGDVRSQLTTNPNVTGVDVKFSPFWVNSVPKKTTKITVVIAKPTTAAKTNAAQP